MRYMGCTGKSAPAMSRPNKPESAPRAHRTGALQPHTDPSGIQTWAYTGHNKVPTRHRDDRDAPAVVHPDGTQEWFLHGSRSRLNGPAVVTSTGIKEWWLDGVLYARTTPPWFRSSTYP